MHKTVSFMDVVQWFEAKPRLFDLKPRVSEGERDGPWGLWHGEDCGLQRVRVRRSYIDVLIDSEWRFSRFSALSMCFYSVCGVLRGSLWGFKSENVMTDGFSPVSCELERSTANFTPPVELRALAGAGCTDVQTLGGGIQDLCN